MANVYYYKGRDQDGNLIADKISANTIDEVVAYLNRHKIVPIDITPAVQKETKTYNIPLFTFGLRKIETYHIMNFCRELAVLHNAGLSIVKAINKLAMSSSSKRLQIILSNVSNDIASGMTLSDALKKHPSAFSPIVVNIIDIGENTGHLSEALIQLGGYLDASIANSRRLASAIRYPLFVLISAAAAIILMNFLVIPKFSMMFSKFNLDLPIATRIIIGISDFMVNNKFILLGVFIFLFVGGYNILKLPGISYLWDKYKLKIPITGSIQKRIILSQFTWTFSLILKSGIPIIKGITLASNATPNAYFRAKLLDMRTAIEHGESLSKAAIATSLFTPMTIQIIEVGEESEKLDEALAEIAKYYDSEIDYDLKRINELIEPILLMGLGVLVLILALGIYFPLWDLIKIAKF